MMRGPTTQALLEGRFDLKVHREKREGPVYLLTVANGPLKLHETREGTCVPFDFSEGLNMTFTGQTFCAVPTVTRKESLTIWDAHGITLAAFSKFQHFEGRGVIDETGDQTLRTSQPLQPLPPARRAILLPVPDRFSWPFANNSGSS